MRTIDEIKTPTGGLFSLGGYVSWEPGDKTITLDGEFTADELRALAEHMDKESKK